MVLSVDKITTPLILEDSQKKFDKLEFGVRYDATDTVDLELGENYDLPGPPPGGLHAFFRIYNPESGETTSSYLDYKAMPQIRANPVEFTLHTFFVVDYLKFRWEPFDKELVDSAFIEDVYGAGIKIDMLENSVATVDNPSIVKFDIRIWFSDKVANVKELDNSGINMYPIPAQRNISIEGHTPGAEYFIYDMTGVLKAKGTLEQNQERIDLKGLRQGTYLFNLFNNENLFFKKIIIVE